MSEKADRAATAIADWYIKNTTHAEKWDVLKELVREAVNGGFEEGLGAVTSIRCLDHRSVPPLNREEGNGGECAVCALAAERASADERVKAERERCAEIAWNFDPGDISTLDELKRWHGQEIAAAIRKGGDDE